MMRVLRRCSLLLLAAMLVAGCGTSSTRLPVTGAAPAAPADTAGSPAATPGMQVLYAKVDGPPANSRTPLPFTPLPAPPYNDREPHPLPLQAADSQKILRVLAPVVKNWAHPGDFEVDSVWQIRPDLQVLTGYLTEVLAPAVIAIPAGGEPRYVGIPPSGGGGPAWIMAVRFDWILIRQGNGYRVFNYRTGQLERSDENGVPLDLVASGEFRLAPAVVATVWQPKVRTEMGQGAPIRVTDAAGQELLQLEGGVLEVVGTRAVGAPYPVLLLMKWGGGSMGMFYEAYLFDPADRKLKRVDWDGAAFVISRAGVEQVANGVRTTYRQEMPSPDARGRYWRERFVIWRYRDGLLRRAEEGDVAANGQ